MKVFFVPFKYSAEYWHLITDKQWEKDPSGRYLQVLRVRLFCEDVGRVHTSDEKYRIEDYTREKHLKKLCPDCVLKAKKSKRHAPTISET